MRIRERFEQDAVKHAEYGCGRSYTQGKGEDSNRGETWGFAQRAQSVANVLQHDFNKRYSARIPAFLLDLIEPAKDYPYASFCLFA